jgi:hypothetical protein
LDGWSFRFNNCCCEHSPPSIGSVLGEQNFPVLVVSPSPKPAVTSPPSRMPTTDVIDDLESDNIGPSSDEPMNVEDKIVHDVDAKPDYPGTSKNFNPTPVTSNNMPTNEQMGTAITALQSQAISNIYIANTIFLLKIRQAKKNQSYWEVMRWLSNDGVDLFTCKAKLIPIHGR